MATDWKAAAASMMSTLMRRGRTVHEAEDLFQEAWVRFATYEHKDEVERPEAFMMRTALNLSIDMHRHEQVQGERVPLEEAEIEDPAPGAEETLLARERMARADACLRSLSPRTREIFMAHRVDGLTFQEVADRFGITFSAVEYHVARALAALLQALRGC
jgi:RNA polymerase sigma-70 factor (ECF subfamily)